MNKHSHDNKVFKCGILSHGGEISCFISETTFLKIIKIVGSQAHGLGQTHKLAWKLKGEIVYMKQIEYIRRLSELSLTDNFAILFSEKLSLI